MWRRACLGTGPSSASLLFPALQQRRAVGADTGAAAATPNWATAVERLPGGVAVFADVPAGTRTPKEQVREGLAFVRRRTEACLEQRSRLRRCYVTEGGRGGVSVPHQVEAAAEAGFEAHEVIQSRFTEGKAPPVHISLTIDLAEVGAQAPTHLVVAASGLNRVVLSLVPQLSAMSCPLWLVLPPGGVPSKNVSQAGVGQITETECHPPFTYI